MKMKKYYIKPSLTIIKVKQAEIICTSGGYGATFAIEDNGDFEHGDITW